MIEQYIQEALARAHYEMIDDDDPFYGEIKGLKGVFSTGKTLEECRNKLFEVLEGWIIMRLRQNLRIPSINGFTIEKPKKLAVHG